MTAPVFLVDHVGGDVLALVGPEGRHAATVRRVRVGEEVHLVDGRGGRAICVVAGLGRDTVSLTVRERRDDLPANPRVVLVQAVAKGDRGESAVTMATEAGVDGVVPWAAQRSIVEWVGERGERSRSRWVSAAREAGKQSRRAWLPDVAPLATTRDVADLLGRSACALVLHESATEPLSAVALPGEGDIVVVVGPEGGITDDELATFTAAGARSVRLGASVLRTSTAGVAAVSAISALTERWS